MYGGNYIRLRSYKAKKVAITGGNPATNIRDEGYQYIVIKNVGTANVMIVNEGETVGYTLEPGNEKEFFFGSDAGLFVYADSNTEVEVLEYELDTVG